MSSRGIKKYELVLYEYLLSCLIHYVLSQAHLCEAHYSSFVSILVSYDAVSRILLHLLSHSPTFPLLAWTVECNIMCKESITSIKVGLPVESELIE